MRAVTYAFGVSRCQFSVVVDGNFSWFPFGSEGIPTSSASYRRTGFFMSMISPTTPMVGEARDSGAQTFHDVDFPGPRPVLSSCPERWPVLNRRCCPWNVDSGLAVAMGEIEGLSAVYESGNVVGL